MTSMTVPMRGQSAMLVCQKAVVMPAAEDDFSDSETEAETVEERGQLVFHAEDGARYLYAIARGVR